MSSLIEALLQVIHGTHDPVNFICDHPDIKAVSFVGGDAAGKHIYTRASANGVYSKSFRLFFSLRNEWVGLMN